MTIPHIENLNVKSNGSFETFFFKISVHACMQYAFIILKSNVQGQSWHSINSQGINCKCNALHACVGGDKIHAYYAMHAQICEEPYEFSTKTDFPDEFNGIILGRLT